MSFVKGFTPEEAALMLKLYRGRKFGASHILEDDLLTGYPSGVLDRMRQALNRSKKDGILQARKSKHGDAVSIPPWLGKEVYEELRRSYPWLPRPPWLSQA